MSLCSLLKTIYQMKLVMPVSSWVWGPSIGVWSKWDFLPLKPSTLNNFSIEKRGLQTLSGPHARRFTGLILYRSCHSFCELKWAILMSRRCFTQYFVFLESFSNLVYDCFWASMVGCQSIEVPFLAGDSTVTHSLQFEFLWTSALTIVQCKKKKLLW